MPVWLSLALAIALETAGTSALALSQGFSRWLPGAVALACYAASFVLLAMVLRQMPVGVAYAIWSGAGVALIALIGWAFLRQPLDLPALIGIALIVAGVIVINLFSAAGH